ncbi:MAG: hypothetical protein M3Q08_01030 [Pseudomonadota bacterium]|nr:hypothetical protein [Pseudomonadota bacterium]
MSAEAGALRSAPASGPVRHTPGPWDLGQWSDGRRQIIVPSDQPFVAKVVAEVLSGRIEDDWLIRAAPDVRSAAAALLSVIDNHAAAVAEPLFLEERSALRAALAKAEGRQA